MDHTSGNTRSQAVDASQELTLEQYLSLEAELIHHSGIDRSEWLEMFSLLLRQIIDEDKSLAYRFVSSRDKQSVLFEIKRRLAKKRAEQIELGLIK